MKFDIHKFNSFKTLLPPIDIQQKIIDEVEKKKKKKLREFRENNNKLDKLIEEECKNENKGYRNF